MKIVDMTAKEFLGEEGAHLFAEFDPQRDGVRLHIKSDGKSRTIDLDVAETARLTEAMATSDPTDRKRGREFSVRFNGPDELTLAIYADNMGEPYRSGISVWLSSPKIHAGLFLGAREAAEFSDFLAANAPSAALSPRI